MLDPRPALRAATLLVLAGFAVARAADPDQDLLSAARHSNLAAATAALAAGAKVDARTPYGVTPLMYAADRGNLELIRLLIGRGADVNAKDTFYKGGALMQAAWGNHAAVVRALLEAGAEGADDLLAGAATEGPLEMVQAILASGKASPAALGRALAAARGAGQGEIAAALAAAGAKEPEAAPAVAVLPEVLQSYSGTYKNAELGMEIRFVPAEGKLRGTVAGQPTVTYAPSNPTTFDSVEFPGVRVVFDVAAGQATGLTIERGGGRYAFKRLAEPPAAAQAAPPAPAPAPTPAAAPAPAPAATAAAAAMPVAVKNWPSFRGAGATGVADGQNPPVSWNVDTGQNVAWKTPIPGLAHSSPVVWGEHVFVTTAVSSAKNPVFRAGLYGDVASVEAEPVHQWKVLALDRRTGKVLWERTAHEGAPRTKRHTKATHANSTPATDGKHVVALFGAEGLYVYDVEGRLLWKKDLGRLDAGFFFDPDDQWGYGSSPIIHGDAVIVQCDVQEQSFIAAFGLADGKELWRTSRDEIPSWGSPTVIEGPGHAELVTNGTRAVRAYDPRTGKELWRLTGNSEITVPTPFAAHGLIFVASGYAPVQPIWAVRPGGSGDITPAGDADSGEHIAWSKKRGGPYMPTPIAYGDHLYTCANNGVLACYDARTGAAVYKGRVAGERSAAFTASPVAADGRLYFASEEGDVYVVQAGPEYALLATSALGEAVLATPAIAGGMLFVRGQHHVFALGAPLR